MIVICVYCKKTRGEKWPFWDKRITHSACPKCAEEELKKIAKVKEKQL